MTGITDVTWVRPAAIEMDTKKIKPHLVHANKEAPAQWHARLNTAPIACQQRGPEWQARIKHRIYYMPTRGPGTMASKD